MSGTVHFSSRELEAFWILLRSGLWEKEPEDLSLFPLPPGSWQMIYRLAVRQTVTGIVYRGICHLPDDGMPPEHLLLKWVASVDDIERQNVRMNKVLAELYGCFTSLGMKVILQKGQGVAAYYAHPLLRECGDIDFYFPERKDYERTAVWLQKQSVRVERAADESFHYSWRGIKVEHHVHLFDLNAPSVRKYLKEQEQQVGWVLSEPLPIVGQRVEVPSPLLNMVLLNAHILKHALGHGVGLRQLCDMARAGYHLSHEVSSDELGKMYDRVGLRKWSVLLYAFLVKYLGFPQELSPYAMPSVTDSSLLDIVLRGGNFGFHEKGQARQVPQKVWIRKYRTMASHLRNLRFAMRYAPLEMYWILWTLIKGQTRR